MKRSIFLILCFVLMTIGYCENLLETLAGTKNNIDLEDDFKLSDIENELNNLENDFKSGDLESDFKLASAEDDDFELASSEDDDFKLASAEDDDFELNDVEDRSS